MGKKRGQKPHRDILPILVAVAAIFFVIAMVKYPSLVLYEEISMPGITEQHWCTPGLRYGNITVIEPIDETYCHILLQDGSEAVVTLAELTP